LPKKKKTGRTEARTCAQITEKENLTKKKPPQPPRGRTKARETGEFLNRSSFGGSGCQEGPLGEEGIGKAQTFGEQKNGHSAKSCHKKEIGQEIVGVKWKREEEKNRQVKSRGEKTVDAGPQKEQTPQGGKHRPSTRRNSKILFLGDPLKFTIPEDRKKRSGPGRQKVPMWGKKKL